MYSLFTFAPIECVVFMSDACFVMWSLVSFLVHQHLSDDETTGCFALIMLWLSVFCVSSNRNYLGQFREIPWNQTTDVHGGSSLIMRVIA